MEVEGTEQKNNAYVIENGIYSISINLIPNPVILHTTGRSPYYQQIDPLLLM